jgi:hypothetical protein
MRQSTNEAYLSIFKYIFPISLRRRFLCYDIDREYLQGVCNTIYRDDLLELGGASCYSASIVAQSLAYIHNIPSNMVIGIKKEDSKIIGHAWVELIKKHSKNEIISPGSIDISEYKVLHRINPENAVIEWITSS